ncbi:thioredoxin family protein [Flavobacterium sp.]|uniref:thioredoxin family protein n=1 Tax=Flavobacterium sp. TaxID=239 RepID=UPI0025C55365|nr:thioredoxin family protein [Flavobacterium sp.]
MCTAKFKFFTTMSKFGELINAPVPVLIDFYTEWNEQSVSMHPVIRDVAAALGDKAKVIKIDVDKNQELADALRIKGLPTLMIYKSGQMIWRQSGELDANTIIGLVQEQL